MSFGSIHPDIMSANGQERRLARLIVAHRAPEKVGDGPAAATSSP